MRSLSTCEKEMDLINHARRGGLKTYLSMHEGWGWGFNLLPKNFLWLSNSIEQEFFISARRQKKHILIIFMHNGG